MLTIFTRRTWSGAAVEVGDVYHLQKNGREARAFIATHPRGVELRLEIAGEPQPRSQVAVDDEPLMAIADG